jgi:NADPH:quinone reductase-like Zn-dependent oxidoreductase
VGSAAVEIAVAQGATVIGTASERNHAFLTALGAVPTTYGPGLAQRLSALAPRGVDTALDTAASGSLDDLVAITGDPTRVATVADHAGGQRLGTHVVNAENVTHPVSNRPTPWSGSPTPTHTPSADAPEERS